MMYDLISLMKGSAWILIRPNFSLSVNYLIGKLIPRKLLFSRSRLQATGPFGSQFEQVNILVLTCLFFPDLRTTFDSFYVQFHHPVSIRHRLYSHQPGRRKFPFIAKVKLVLYVLEAWQAAAPHSGETDADQKSAPSDTGTDASRFLGYAYYWKLLFLPHQRRSQRPYRQILALRVENHRYLLILIRFTEVRLHQKHNYGRSQQST